MACILTVTRGLPSVVFSSVELARRLAVAGHRVMLAADSGARDLADRHGLDFLPLDRSRYEEFLASDRRQGAIRRLANLRRRRERALSSLAIGGFVRALRERRPDLVLVNGEMHEHIIAAAGIGGRLALLNSFVSIWRCPGLPPPHRLARPGVGWSGSRAGASLLWHDLRLRKWIAATRLRATRVGCDRLSLLRLLARGTGVDMRREIDTGQWLKPFTYRRFPVLSLHAAEFEFTRRQPARVHYVGPMVLASRGESTLTEDDRAALEGVLDRHQRSGGAGRLVYAGFGSAFSTDLALLRRLVAAVEARPDWHLVISLGNRLAPTALGRLPARVQAFAWVPQLRVLDHADVAVIHGGVNTIDECVLAGVPMLVYCGFETDMAGATARVVHHGVGIAGDRRRDDARAIGGHLDRLMREPQFADRLARLGRCYAAYAEQRVLERTVDSLLAPDGRDGWTGAGGSSSPPGAAS